MRSKPLPAHMTLAEYEALPEDGNRYELIDGRVIVTPAPGEAHQKDSLNLASEMHRWARKQKLGTVLTAPFEVLLAGEPDRRASKRRRGARAVQPDIFFVSARRLHLFDGKRLNGAPDLVVELFHHRGALYDTEEKRTLYALHGVSEYWLIDLDRKLIVVLNLTETGYEETSRATEGGRVRSTVLTGFEIDWFEVFRQD